MKKTVLSGVAAAVVLAACGGGSPDTNNIPPAQAPSADAAGIYQGTDSSNDAVAGVILDTGVYYFIYTNQTSNTLGLVQGTSSSSGGTFKSTDAKNFVIAQNIVLNDTISATYTKKANIGGTIAPASGNGAGTTFSANYSTVYDQTPTAAALAGTYVGAGGSVKGAEAVTITVGSDWTFTGKGPSGCTFKGLLAPHNGKNVLDATISFGGSPCTYPNTTVSGVVVQNNNQLIAAAALPDRSDAFVAVGSK